MRNIYTNGNSAATAAPSVINGRGLQHRNLDARQRASLGADILDGLAVMQSSIRQLARQLGVNERYIRLAQRLTPEKRRAILSGRDSTSFASLIRPPIGRRPLLKKRASFAAIERVLS
jgi:hypothetical protein